LNGSGSSECGWIIFLSLFWFARHLLYTWRRRKKKGG
jgi:hypothetical protein